MKLIKPLLMCSLLAASLTSSLAWAQYGYGHGFHHGHHARAGVFIGVPLAGAYYAPRYYYPPQYYAYPSPAPVVVAPAAPPVYVEQGAPQQAATQLSPNYWYYCRNPQGYYPYVKDCSTGWQKVAPQPSSQQ
jgi:hypothetical protein